MLKMIARAALMLGLFIQPARAALPDAAGLEILLNLTADRMTTELGEGKGYSYYTYGTKELMVATGDLDGDGKPEIAARGVYFMGVGSYDLVDIFQDRGQGYERVDFINLYNVGLLDKVKSLQISNGVLQIETTAIERGASIVQSAAFHWTGPEKLVKADAPNSQAPGLAPSASISPPINSAPWEFKVVRGKKIAGVLNGAPGIQALNLFCEGNIPVFAVTFNAAQPNPVRLEIQIGNMIYPFVLAHQPNAGGIRMVNLKQSAFPKKLLEGDEYAQISLNGMSYGVLSLKNAAAASRQSLADCYRY
ncbi:hypothetical protein NP590_07935 [Methylomonas sp. SURF-2]|uniref:VCBS repeat-containing protein n=1 Tax=Methylomonas subterranea TaxID=2952225 RepID=A0ABT1TGX9_9GAMM|nr:hypothetical protein [Methylomonas sp. SURF-2]MCQ8104029.1 hypothetical protein [Methylomonas sp. SURF-2]